jgi:hypothetical protein
LFLPIIAYTLSSTKLERRAEGQNTFCLVMRGKEGGGEKGEEMTQIMYAHMNIKN